MPKSKPIELPVLFSWLNSISVLHIETKYLPLGLLETVAFNILPSNTCLSLVFINPSLGNLIYPLT